MIMKEVAFEIQAVKELAEAQMVEVAVLKRKVGTRNGGGIGKVREGNRLAQS